MSEIKCLRTIIIFATLVVFAAAIQENMTQESLVKLVSDFRNSYGIHNVFIAGNEAASDIQQSSAYISLLKKFSRQSIFTMITTIADISKDIPFNSRRMDRSFFVVIIKSESDYNDFVNVTKTNNMNLYRILVIFTTNTELCQNPIGNPFNLVFHSKMIVKCPYFSTIREWYSLHPNKTEIINFLKWDPNIAGFKLLSNANFYERRNSLEGITLRVSTTRDSVDQNGKPVGFFGNVLNELSRAAHFNVELQPFEIASGSFDPETSTYTGIMGKLYEKKIDIGLGEFTVTQERMNIVEFSDPIYISNTNFYIKNSHASHILWSMYYKAFGVKACLLICVIYLISPVLLTVIKPRNSNNILLNIYDNYFDVWGMFCMKSPSDIPKQTSARIAYYSLYILSFMLSSIYSALLVSYLTIFKPDMPFNSLDDFFAAKTHKLITVKDTSFIDTFKFSKDPLIRQLSSFLLDGEDLPNSVSEAIELVKYLICLKNKDVALYMDDVILQSKRFNIPCELIPFERGRLSSMGLAFPKNSPYVGLINYHLHRMRNFGLLNAIEDQNLKRLEPSQMTYKSVNFWSTIPLYGILGCGAGLALVILILEKIIFYIRHQRCHNFNSIPIHVHTLLQKF